MKTLITDGAKHFLSVDVKRWVKERGVPNVKYLAYDRNINGIAKRCIQLVLGLLKKQQFSHLNVRWWYLVPKYKKR